GGMTLQSRVRVRRPGQSAQAVTSCSKRTWPGAVKQGPKRCRNVIQDAGAGTWAGLRWPPPASWGDAAEHVPHAVRSAGPLAAASGWQARHHATRGHLHVRTPGPLAVGPAYYLSPASKVAKSTLHRGSGMRQDGVANSPGLAHQHVERRAGTAGSRPES